MRSPRCRRCRGSRSTSSCAARRRWRGGCARSPAGHSSRPPAYRARSAPRPRPALRRPTARRMPRRRRAHRPPIRRWSPVRSARGSSSSAGGTASRSPTASSRPRRASSSQRRSSAVSCGPGARPVRPPCTWSTGWRGPSSSRSARRRSRSPRTPYRAQFASAFKDQGARVDALFSAVESDPRSAEAEIASLQFDLRAHLLAAATVQLGAEAPERWREIAKLGLFPGERPYFQ